MTKEEALKILRSEILEPYTGEYSSELKCIAIRRGIEALEQEPCEDCISREEVREFVNFVQLIKDNHNEQGKPINYGTICDIVIRAHKLLDLPPMQPKRKHGKWIKLTNKTGTVIALRCSYCKKSPKHAIRSLYCPNCGAKMGVEE